MNFSTSHLQAQLTEWLMRRTATSGVRRVAALSAALACEIGSVRGDNQDRVAIARGRDHAGRVFVVAALADGIGGMRDGAACAATALGYFIGEIVENARVAGETRDWLPSSAHRANMAVHARYRGTGGSTLVALLIDGEGQAYWLSVGDSRVYRAHGSQLSQLSVDDTIAGQLGKPAEAGFDQAKLLQFIGIGEPLEPHMEPVDASAGGAILLTSDGVHFLASAPDWLGLVVGNAFDPGACVRRLIELAKWCGGPDNASVAMIPVGSQPKEEALPAHLTLEVWDSFGELQIIVETVRSPNPDVLASNPVQPMILQTSAGDPLAKKGIDETSAEPPKPKRTRSAKKSKPSDLGPAAQVKRGRTREVPQVLIEFPNKAK